jgi:hypothetical protein
MLRQSLINSVAGQDSLAPPDRIRRSILGKLGERDIQAGEN